MHSPTQAEANTIRLIHHTSRKNKEQQMFQYRAVGRIRKA